jgi:DNA-binding response OmpR family regulator
MSIESPNARILIVDDQVSNVSLLEFTLRRAGYVAVSSTTDPTKVAPLHLENQYELMILDLHMPVMSGFDVMEQLRGAEEKQRVAILVMSADAALMISALEAGADSFLSKPYRLPEVLQRVQLLLKSTADMPNA